MLDWPEAEGDSAAGVSNVLWVVVDVRVLPNYRLHVRFVDGTEGEVDASRLLGSMARRSRPRARRHVRRTETYGAVAPGTVSRTRMNCVLY